VSQNAAKKNLHKLQQLQPNILHITVCSVTATLEENEGSVANKTKVNSY